MTTGRALRLIAWGLLILATAPAAIALLIAGRAAVFISTVWRLSSDRLVAALDAAAGPR